MTAQRSFMERSPFQDGIADPFDLNGSTRPPSLTRQTQKLSGISATIFPSVRFAGLSGRFTEPGPFPSPLSPWQSAHLATKISLPLAIILGSVQTRVGMWALAYSAGIDGCTWSPWAALGGLACGCCACTLRSASPASQAADTARLTMAMTTDTRARVTDPSCSVGGIRPSGLRPEPPTRDRGRKLGLQNGSD